MKRLLKNKVLTLAIMAALTLATVNCGILMHPERKGQTGGTIDNSALIMDCLWLLAAVVPGVVALVVDYATGGIYESGTTMKVAPGQEFAFALRGRAPADAEVEVLIQDQDGRVVSLLDHNVNEGEVVGGMTFALPTELEEGKYSLSLTVNDAPQAEWGLIVASAQE